MNVAKENKPLNAHKYIPYVQFSNLENKHQRELKRE